MSNNNKKLGEPKASYELNQLMADLEKMQAVVNAIPGHVSWIDEDFTYIGVNEGLAQALNMKPDEIIGKKIGFSEKRNLFRDFVENFFKSEKTSDKTVIQSEFSTEGDGPVWHSLFARRYDNGRKAVVVGFDVTELKKAYQTIAGQQVAIATQSKMSALGEMAASVTHEINNPMQVVTGYAEIIKGSLEDVKDEDETESILISRKTFSLLKKSAQSIETAVRHINKVVAGFRSYSRDSSADPMEKSKVSEILDNTQVLCQEKFKTHRIRLEILKPNEEIPIMCRPTQVVQVLINLLNNACDAIAHMDERWVKLDVALTDTEILFQVTDSGHGIPAEHRDKILEPFYSTKAIGKGSGIGLSISKKIVAAHNGILTIDASHPNTKFVVKFPRIS